MDARNPHRRPGRPRSRDGLRVELSRPLPLPADSLLPWEEELVVASIAPPVPSPPPTEAVPGAPVAPFGFRTGVVDEDSGTTHLAIDPGEATVVREAFRLYLTESGGQSVARTLNDRGRRTRDGQLWDKAAVLAILDDPAVADARHRVAARGEEGRTAGRSGMFEPPTNDKATVALVRRLRADRDPASAPGRAAGKSQLLKGLVHCGRCDDDYQLETSGKNVNGARYRYTYYNCRSATRSGVADCPGRRLSTAALDKAVIEVVRESVCRESRFTALAAANGWSPEPARDALANLLTRSKSVARIYLLHLVRRLDVFTDRVVLTPRTETRFRCEIRRDLPSCA